MSALKLHQDNISSNCRPSLASRCHSSAYSEGDQQKQCLKQEKQIFSSRKKVFTLIIAFVLITGFVTIIKIDFLLSSLKNDKQFITAETWWEASHDFGIVSSTSTPVINNSILKHQNRYSDVLDELDALSGGPNAKNLECTHPLVPFQNVIIRPTNIATSSEEKLLIPKVLHFSFVSRCLPQDIARTIDRWKKRLPNYSIFFHDDEAVARLIGQEWSEFPNLHRALKCLLLKGAMLSDVWRMLLLFKYGGVYTDVDNWPLDGFDEKTIRHDLSFSVWEEGKYGRLSHHLFGSAPGHPIIFFAMNLMMKNLMELEDIFLPRVMSVTGPEMMMWAYKMFLAPKFAGNIADEKILENDVELTGMFGMKVLKGGNFDDIASVKYEYSAIVPFNSTFNVTRADRIRMESGTLHWTQGRRKAPGLLKKHNIPRNCQAYLDQLDKGSVKEVEPVRGNEK